MIQISNLTYSVGEKIILSDIKTHIKKGSIVGVIGKNGAGKSTLIKCLAGLYSIERNKVTLNGRDITSVTPKELSQERVVLSQEIPVSFGLSVLDILMMGRYPFHPLKKEDFEYVDQIIEDLNLAPLLDTPYPRLSGGERQRVQFGRVLCQLMPYSEIKNKVLFLDEPLAALDLSIQQKVLKYVTRLREKFGLTIVLVLHDLNWISGYCDRVLLLEEGKLVKEGSPTETFTQENLKKYFNVETNVILNDDEKPTIVYL